MYATAEARERVRVIETLMEGRAHLDEAIRADSIEDEQLARAKRYVRGIVTSLKAAGEADHEHDVHLARAVEQFNSALAALDGYVQLELPVERAS